MSSLPDFLKRKALDAVDLQVTLDRDFQQQLRRMKPYMEALDQDQVRALLWEALIPSRMLVRRHTFSAQLRLEISKSRGFELSCRTIPLHFKALTASSSLDEQGFEIQIEQVPLAVHPFIDSSKT